MEDKEGFFYLLGRKKIKKAKSTFCGFFSVSKVNSKSVTTRVEVRHELYLVEVQSDARLSPSLRDRLLGIASMYQSNNNEAAWFETQLLVRDYGTHFVRSVVAGGKTTHSVSVSFYSDDGFQPMQKELYNNNDKKTE